MLISGNTLKKKKNRSAFTLIDVNLHLPLITFVQDFDLIAADPSIERVCQDEQLIDFEKDEDDWQMVDFSIDMKSNSEEPFDCYSMSRKYGEYFEIIVPRRYSDHIDNFARSTFEDY